LEGMSSDLSAQLRAHLQGQPRASTAKSGGPAYPALTSEITRADTEELRPGCSLADRGLTSVHMIANAIRSADPMRVVLEESDAQALEALDDVAKCVEEHQ